MSTPDEPIHAHIADLADLCLPTGAVLDAGCGNGPTLAAFARSHPAATLVGLDSGRRQS
jgi:trans-aconitate methyltransferase